MVVGGGGGGGGGGLTSKYWDFFAGLLHCTKTSYFIKYDFQNNSGMGVCKPTHPYVPTGLLEDNVIYWSIFKAFSLNKRKTPKMMRSVFEKVQDIVRKQDISGSLHFLLF